MVDVMYQKNLGSVPFGSLECLKDLKIYKTHVLNKSQFQINPQSKIEIVYKPL